ncbi:MAG: 5-(carboxyamino)imidazole ribonucleotide synthase [Brochothrix thermosphacta]|uniref:5-(carboxyamino)imidazole ribonucleotide synthase n=1 Tax=Brochothrix thermosphacta TaxID=2756 RepID=UPI003F905162
MNKQLYPGQTIGIIGGGQLGKMLVLSAKSNGFYVIVLDPVANCPCAQVSDEQIVADYDDKTALKQLAQRADVLTYEFENIDYNALQAVENETIVAPNAEILSITQDRILEKTFLTDLSINVAPFAVIVDRTDIDAKIAGIGFPSVLKTSNGGYDGKGQVVMQDEQDIEEAAKLLQYGPCVLEAWIPFDSEASILVSRNHSGDIQLFPVVENEHRDNILHLTIAPARLSAEVILQAESIATKLAQKTGLVGTLAIELFIGKNEAVYVNELAPRPHNSGHYSIEACDFSQFEQHIRAIADWPLQRPQLLKKAIMVNVLGQHVDKVYAAIPHHPDWHIHMYGKDEAKHNRKMGHITLLTNDVESALEDLKNTRIWD